MFGVRWFGSEAGQGSEKLLRGKWFVMERAGNSDEVIAHVCRTLDTSPCQFCSDGGWRGFSVPVPGSSLRDVDSCVRAVGLAAVQLCGLAIMLLSLRRRKNGPPADHQVCLQFECDSLLAVRGQQEAVQRLSV